MHEVEMYFVELTLSGLSSVVVPEDDGGCCFCGVCAELVVFESRNNEFLWIFFPGLKSLSLVCEEFCSLYEKVSRFFIRNESLQGRSGGKRYYTAYDHAFCI